MQLVADDNMVVVGLIKLPMPTQIGTAKTGNTNPAIQNHLDHWIDWSKKAASLSTPPSLFLIVIKVLPPIFAQ
jgi:hypothetical protein